MIQDVDWKTVICAASLAAVVSILTAVATGLPEAKNTEDAGDDKL